jgi:hypothetical protein
MTRLDNEKYKNGEYKIESRLRASDKRWEKRKAESTPRSKVLKGEKPMSKKSFKEMIKGAYHSKSNFAGPGRVS